MENTTTVKTNGIGVCGLLGVAFVVLKLCKVIDWSWWWVTAPFWVPTALFLGIIGAAFCLILVAALFGTGSNRMHP